MKQSAWITNWAYIIADKKYIVCPINAREDKTLYIGQPSVMIGWEVSRLMEKCYAALPMPEFEGIK